MSFQQGLSGLNAASKSLEAIGNNVANSGTVGFKQSQVQFSDVYASSLAGSGSAQIGMGTQVARVAQLFSQGNITASNNPLDMAINGDGFFRMSNGGAISYARNGQFTLSKEGFIEGADGGRLTGYMADAAGVVAVGAPTELKINKADLGPSATTSYQLSVKLDSRKGSTGTVGKAQVDNSNIQSMTTALGSNVQASTVTAGNFSLKGSNAQTSVVAANYSLKGSNAQTGINTTTDYGSANATFTVGGNAVSLDKDYTTGAATAALQTDAMVADLNTTAIGKLGGKGITASKTADGAITFTRDAVAGSADQAAVAITGTDAAAVSAGIVATAGTAGTGINFTVAGTAVNLEGNYSSSGTAGMATDITAQLSGITASSATSSVSGAVAGASTGQTVTGFSFGTAGSAQVDNSNIQSITTALGSNTGAATAASINYTASSSVINVGGTSITLAADYTGAGTLQTYLNTQLSTANITATVTSGGAVSFARNDAGNTKAIAVTADANATTNSWVAGGGTGTFNASAFDFATGGASAMGQFTVDAGANQVTVSLNQAYGAGDIGGAAMAADVQTQLRAAGGANLNYAASYDTTSKSLVITKAGASTGVNVSTIDANTLAAGIATQSGSGYVAPVATTNATMTIDGTNIALTADDANIAGVAAELTTKMQASALGANYSAVVTAGKLEIRHTGSTNAVVLTNVDSKAATAGFVNSTGVTGTAAQTTAKTASLTVGSTNITLDSNYDSADGLAGALNGKLSSAGYTATNALGVITISRIATGASSTAVNISNGMTNGVAGLSAFNDPTSADADGNIAGTAGANAVATTNASFKVDGSIVTLASNFSSGALMATEVGSQLGAGYTVAYDTATSKLNITNSTAGTAAVTLTANTAATTDEKANAISTGFGAKVGTAGTVGGAVTVGTGTMTITSGTGVAVDMSGVYATSQKLADAINANVNGVYATIADAKNADGSANANAGKLQLSSATDFTVTGGGQTLTAGVKKADQGSLNALDVKSVAGANKTINAIDSALKTVSTLRSTFGAIQNRFDSVISNLASTSENLSSARSRIQDTDFAAETANLTRGQILQQAGTAMLAQANSLPNGVLALLRG